MHEVGQWTLLIYGAVLILGGILAYARAQSVMSLVSGVVSGILIYVAYFLSRTQPRSGFALGAIVALLLTVNFALRFRGKFMPTGLLLLVSVLALGLLCAAWIA
ncbi:MAG TPA: TMEM14 family protein [Chthonomonadaceae bacterium]|nr:TMEM14 family protein [Chthonomonadaceae bacterium]